MNDHALLAIVAGIALVFEIQAVENLAPVIWGPADLQVVSLCVASPDGSCDRGEPLPVPGRVPSP